MRWLVAAILVMTGAILVEAGNLGWFRYINDRYGASAEVPGTLFIPEPAPENGDGQSYRSHEDGAVVRIYGSLYSATADTFVAYRTAILKDAGNDGLAITYKKVGPNFFVYSGLKGALIVYSKTIFGCKDVAETIEIEYPASSKSLYDSLVTRMAGSLAVRPSIECP